MAARETVDNFIKNYRLLEAMTPSERGARFLNDLAEKFPNDFVSRAKLAKIIFNLPSVPRETNDYMKKIGSNMQRIDKILQTKYKRKIKSDRIDGYRATSSDADLMINVVRVQVRRAHLAQERVNNTISMVNPRNLGGGLKTEFENVRDTFKQIEERTSKLPQLPPKRHTDGPNSTAARNPR